MSGAAVQPALRPADTTGQAPSATEYRSRPWRRFRRSRAAAAGALLIVAIALVCLLTLPWSLSEGQAGQPRYNRQMAGPILVAPSAAAPLGTDELGRSLVPRVLFGGAISLGVGLAAAIIAVTIGVTWGAIAGYVGGRVDGVMMRIVDVLYGLPYILLVILIKLALEDPLAGLVRSSGVANAAGTASVVILFVAIGSVSWLTMARVVRGQVLSLKARPFVEAARASGAGGGRILLHHILPNLVGPVLVYATLIVPQAILQESFLSFLGIGIAPPIPTWGSLASEGVQYLNSIRIYWWLVLWPCAALAVTLLSLNFVGDGLRDALDPSSA
jgi:oligopeptide transport system permease protein